MISREQLLGIALPEREVEVRPGMTVKIRGLTIAEQMKLIKLTQGDETKAGVLGVFMALVEPKLDPADHDSFHQLPSDVFSTLAAALGELNLDAPKALAELEGESETSAP
jgi:hypothetical protein